MNMNYACIGPIDEGGHGGNHPCQYTTNYVGPMVVFHDQTMFEVAVTIIEVTV